MKRDELKALDLTDEQVATIMQMYGKSVTELHNGLTAAQTDAEKTKAELKKYQKDGEYYVDKKEFDRLKTFETETLTKAEKEKKTIALAKLYKGANASESAAKLLIAGSDLSSIELDDKGEVKNGADLLKKAKADYADFFTANGNGCVPQGASNDTANGGGGTKRKQVVF